MANKTSDKNNNNNNNNSGLPLVIIGIVLLVAIVGGWWLYSSSKATPQQRVNTNTVSNNPQPQPNNTPITSTVLGAQPPHFKGAQNSPVVIEEFADYQCPTCAAMHPVMNEINAMYGSRIKFIYRNYPLTQIHKNGYDAAVAAEAAGLQGKFWEMQNLLFQNQRNWSNADDARSLFADYAQTIGLDVEKFKSDMSGMAAKQRVDADLGRGRSLNISSTPTIFVNGVSVPYPQMTVDGMKQIIDAELAKTGNQQSQPSEPKAPTNKTAEEQGIEKPATNTNTSK